MLYPNDDVKFTKKLKENILLYPQFLLFCVVTPLILVVTLRGHSLRLLEDVIEVVAHDCTECSQFEDDLVKSSQINFLKKSGTIA